MTSTGEFGPLPSDDDDSVGDRGKWTRARPPAGTRIEAAERLLDAGRALLRATSPATLLPGVRAVCDAAGMSSGSFYWQYPDASTYWSELLQAMSATDPVREFAVRMEEGLLAGAEAIRADPSVAVSTIAALAATDVEFHATHGIDALRLQLALLGVAQDDGPLSQAVLALYRDLYATIQEHHVAGYEVLLSAWGRVPRDPFSYASMSVTITAVADGMLMRTLFDTTNDLLTLFEDSISALLASITRRIGDERDLFGFMDDEFRPQG